MGGYHGYNVRSMLESYFGMGPLQEMRAEHERWQDASDTDGLIPHAWEQADEKMLFLFQSEYFLLDTRLCDDYIVYFVQEKHHKTAILTFLHFTDEPFLLDAQYAMGLTCQWEQKGYDVLLACIHITTTQMDGYDGKKLIEFDPRAARAGAVELLRAKEICGKSILVREEPLPCWLEFKRNFVSTVQLNRAKEYKCLLSDDVTVFEGDDEDKIELTSGFRKVVDHLAQIAAPRLVYAVFRGDLLYTRTVIAGDREIILNVNATNQIHEIIERPVHVEKLEILPAEDVTGISLVEQMPEIMAVRPLDPAAVHAYAIQVDFSDESVRNYYLATFDSPEIPEGLNVGGYWFTEDTVQSVRPYRDGSGNGICFDNGFSTPSQTLYYRGYVQLKTEQTEGCVFQCGKISIVRRHRTPLRIDWHRGGQRYFGSESECFGPSNAILTPDGSRASAASYWKIWDSFGTAGIAMVTVEPTGKAGYIRKEDGTWLFPPVYESATQFDDFQCNCAVAERRVNGGLMQFLLTRSGKEIPWEYYLDTESCFNGLCPFSVVKPEYDRDQLPEPFDNLESGTWGYINEEGKIVIEPQYAYVASFYIGDGAFAIVAKRTEEGLRWGAIDTDGREIIPCIYRNLYSRSGNVLIYQPCDNELYGLLDLNGNTIMEPKFRYIGDYNQKHGLVACGDYEEEAGVYSIRQGKMIVPPKYDCISFENCFISAEIALTGQEAYFDYEGIELNFGDYDRVYEPYQMPGHLVAWKAEKCALLKMDGTVLVSFAENNGSNFEYYDQGFLITGNKERLGLCRVSGEMILPERFSKITVCDGFIIASLQAQSAGSVSDELYTLDGKLVLGGAYRNISINDNTMKAETPNGIEYYSICLTSPNTQR